MIISDELQTLLVEADNFEAVDPHTVQWHTELAAANKALAKLKYDSQREVYTYREGQKIDDPEGKAVLVHQDWMDYLRALIELQKSGRKLVPALEVKNIAANQT